MLLTFDIETLNDGFSEKDTLLAASATVIDKGKKVDSITVYGGIGDPDGVKTLEEFYNFCCKWEKKEINLVIATTHSVTFDILQRLISIHFPDAPPLFQHSTIMHTQCSMHKLKTYSY